MCGGFGLAASTERGERLLERLGRLAQAPGLHGGIRPADEELGPLGIIGRGELERSGEPRLGLGGIEPECTLAGERQEPTRRFGQLLGLFRVAGGLGELERLQVVVGEHLGKVLDTLARLVARSRPRQRGADVPVPPSGSGRTRRRRTSRCQNEYSLSPSIELVRAGRTSSLRESSCSASSTSPGSRPPISANAPAQNTFPTTAASWSRLLRSGRQRV